MTLHTGIKNLDDTIDKFVGSAAAVNDSLKECANAVVRFQQNVTYGLISPNASDKSNPFYQMFANTIRKRNKAAKRSRRNNPSSKIMKHGRQYKVHKKRKG